jgi:hypothetical protein
VKAEVRKNWRLGAKPSEQLNSWIWSQSGLMGGYFVDVEVVDGENSDAREDLCDERAVMDGFKSASLPPFPAQLQPPPPIHPSSAVLIDLKHRRSPPPLRTAKPLPPP